MITKKKLRKDIRSWGRPLNGSGLNHIGLASSALPTRQNKRPDNPPPWFFLFLPYLFASPSYTVVSYNVWRWSLSNIIAHTWTSTRRTAELESVVDYFDLPILCFNRTQTRFFPVFGIQVARKGKRVDPSACGSAAHMRLLRVDSHGCVLIIQMIIMCLSLYNYTLI